MDFEVFNRSELEELCQFSADHMPERMRQIIVQEFGSVDQWKQHYIERASKEDIQKSFLKMVEWYGDKESAFQAAIHPPAQEVVDACQNRIDAVCKKLAEKKEEPFFRKGDGRRIRLCGETALSDQTRRRSHAIHRVNLPGGKNSGCD